MLAGRICDVSHRMYTSKLVQRQLQHHTAEKASDFWVFYLFLSKNILCTKKLAFAKKGYDLEAFFENKKTFTKLYVKSAEKSN